MFFEGLWLGSTTLKKETLQSIVAEIKAKKVALS
jgi:hypothetical protein